MPLNTRLVSYVLTLGCLSIPFALEAAPALTPQQLEQALTAAQKAYGQKKYQQALPHFARFYAQNPQAHGVAIQYAYALIQQHQYPTALNVLNGVALRSPNPQEVQQAKKMIAQLVQSFPEAKQYQTQYVQKLHTGNASQTLQQIQSLLKQLDIELGQTLVRVDLISRQLAYANPDNAESYLSAFENFSQELSRRISELRPHRKTLNAYGAALASSNQRLTALKNAQTSRLFKQVNCDCQIDPNLGNYVMTPLIADALLQYGKFEMGLAEIGQRIYQMFASEGDQEAGTWLNYRKQHCQRVHSSLVELGSELKLMRQYELDNLDERIGQHNLIAQRYKQACGG